MQEVDQEQLLNSRWTQKRIQLTLMQEEMVYDRVAQILINVLG